MTEEELRQMYTAATGTTAAANTTGTSTTTDTGTSTGTGTTFKVVEKPNNDYSSPYDQQLKDLYTSITTRQPFSYNADDDAMYQQYKDRYTQLGRQAMKDTMGQAAALTGGYGNTYAQSAGQQAYDEYMLGLNDKAMELYQAAYGRYKDEDSRERQNYAMLGDLADRDYAMWADKYSRDFADYQLNLDEAAQRASFGDYSGISALYGSEAAQNARWQYAAANPMAALNAGLISAMEYYDITGKLPLGHMMSGAGGLSALTGGGGGGGDGGNWYKATGTYDATYNPEGLLYPGAGGSGVGVSASDYWGARDAGMTHDQIVRTVNS